MSEEQPPRPKLIVPDEAAQAPKSQLLVPGAVEGELPAEVPAAPGEVVPVAPEAEGFVVINEEAVEQAQETTASVNIVEMTPPPVEPVAAVEEAVAETPAVEPAVAVEQTYEAPALEQAYEAPALEQAYEAPPVYQEPVQEQPAYQQSYAAPPPPPSAAAYPPPGQVAAPPVGQVAPPVAAAAAGYGQQQPMTMVGQSSGIPSWAMMLLGMLAGFIVTLLLFKFTALAEGLRPDLIEQGRGLMKAKYDALVQQIEDAEAGDEPMEDAEPAAPGDAPSADAGAEPAAAEDATEGGDAADAP